MSGTDRRPARIVDVSTRPSGPPWRGGNSVATYAARAAARADEPHGNVGFLPQPRDHGLDVGDVLRALTEAAKRRAPRLAHGVGQALPVRRRIDDGNHQPLIGEQLPRADEEVAGERSVSEPSVGRALQG